MNVNEAIAAVKANPPNPESPLPWRRKDGGIGEVLAADDSLVCEMAVDEDAAHIAAAVNAAPVIIAEVERLRAQLEAARVAVEAIKPHHSPCNMGCNCDRCKSDFAMLIARRALGLEVGK